MELNQYIDLAQPFAAGGPKTTPTLDHSEQTDFGMTWAARQAERPPEIVATLPTPNPNHFPIAN
jgi:hypothetical protein